MNQGKEFTLMPENKQEHDPILEINSFMEEGTEKERLDSIHNNESYSSDAKFGS